MEDLAFKPWEWSCLNCDETIYANENEDTDDLLLVCPYCDYKHRSLICPHCDSIELFEDIGDHPTSCTCQKCGYEITLPEDFYNKTYHFIKERDLPPEALDYLERQKRKDGLQIILVLLFLVFAIGFVIYAIITK